MGSTLDSKTELAVNTHAIVSGLERNAASTHTMVSKIHCAIVKGQEVNDGNDLLVSATQTLSTAE